MPAKMLTDRLVRTTKEMGVHADGDGLYLRVTNGKDGILRKSFFVRLRLPDGRSRDMGLGRLELVSLADAREKARVARSAAKAGRDPIAAAAAKREAARAARERAVTFKDCAEKFIATRQSSWTNEKHAAQWQSTLARYAYPVFGKLPVAEVADTHIFDVLDPIWSTKRETAARVRQRIEAVLDWARVRGHRSGENPARWRGHLQVAYAARGKGCAQTSFAAMPFIELPDFWTKLSSREGVGAAALRYAILTAARTGEVVGATWDEVDLQNAVWIVPANRMKARREHRVPLSRQAIAELTRLPTREGPLFRGQSGRHISNMTLLAVLKRMNRGDITVHGFRSTFRDWVAETTHFPAEVAEMALAHTIHSAVEKAYRRGDLFEKRRELMEEWGAYCAGGDAALPLRR